MRNIKGGRKFFAEENNLDTFAWLSRFCPAAYGMITKVFGSFFKKRTASFLRVIYAHIGGVGRI
jgi:hypothetical protein